MDAHDPAAPKPSKTALRSPYIALALSLALAGVFGLWATGHIEFHFGPKPQEAAENTDDQKPKGEKDLDPKKMQNPGVLPVETSVKDLVRAFPTKADCYATFAMGEKPAFLVY